MRFSKNVKKRHSRLAEPAVRPLLFAVLGLAALGTLAFIFGNSLQSAATSSGASLSLLELLAPILGRLPFYSHTLIRKLAHFTEYAILGAEGGMTASLSRRPHGMALVFLLAGLLTALFDEFLQTFAEGRAPALTDAAIDLFGFFVGGLLVFLLFRPVRRQITEQNRARTPYGE